MYRLSHKLRNVLLLVCSIILTSCASSSGEIAATYVSPTQYNVHNCDQLSLEFWRLIKRKTDLAESIDKKAKADQSVTAVSAIFWPAAFALGGNQDQEEAYARLKGEYDAMQKAGFEKNCKLYPWKAFTSPLVAHYGTATPGDASVYEYYGDAEDEVNSGNVDKNLWARALVETEGNETKRNAKYIELRANQLYIDNGGSISTTGIYGQPVPEPNESGIDVSGTYVSESIGASWALRNKKKLSITLKQENNSIKGRFINSLDGPIYGTIDKDKIEFKWEAGNCSSGVGSMTLAPDGSTLEGVLICQSQGMRKYEVVFHPI
jgi:hypothetical protein